MGLLGALGESGVGKQVGDHSAVPFNARCPTLFRSPGSAITRRSLGGHGPQFAYWALTTEPNCRAMPRFKGEPSAMPIRFRRSARYTFLLGTAATLALGCDRLSREPQRNESGGEIDESFEPSKVKSVKGVPAAEVRTAIAKRLDAASSEADHRSPMEARAKALRGVRRKSHLARQRRTSRASHEDAHDRVARRRCGRARARRVPVAGAQPGVVRAARRKRRRAPSCSAMWTWC